MSVYPRELADCIAILFCSDGSTRESFSNSRTTSTSPYVEAFRIAKLCLADGLTDNNNFDTVATSPFTHALKNCSCIVIYMYFYVLFFQFSTKLIFYRLNGCPLGKNCLL